ncbi:MAG: hypothetical protein AAGC79_12670 [Pseudomonadota bacterium]
MIAPDDIKAAVSSGVLSEAQAADLTVLAQKRAGARVSASADDEPFELFRGLNDVFVTVGIGLLAFAGGLGGELVALADLGPAYQAALFASYGLLLWAMAEYFTRKRRMVLPSLMIAGLFTVCLLIAGSLVSLHISGQRVWVAEAAALGAMVGTTAFYLRFKLPFAIFLTALSILLAILAVTDVLAPLEQLQDSSLMFNLIEAPEVALILLAFGLACFAIALRFDLSDPHRMTRRSACAFWLHLLAAPAIVNTVALTLYESEGALATLALVLIILLIALIALVIDRRSLLLAAVAYIGAVMSLALDGLDGLAGGAVVFLLLGLLITTLGAGWTRLRNSLMRALPKFPGKDRLPPYVKAQT